MKIKFSAIVSDARGKIGGNVFSRNKAGAYVRTFVKPTNPNSAAQQIIRNRIQGLVTGWRALSDAVRLGWNQTTHNFPQSNKLGETFYLTGQQLFTKFNSNRLAFGEAAATTPPLNSSEEAPRGKTKERNWTERALRSVKKEDGAVTLSLVSSGSFFLSLNISLYYIMNIEPGIYDITASNTGLIIRGFSSPIR